MPCYRFQPIVNLHTEHVIGHEVLLKMHQSVDLEAYFSTLTTDKMVDLFCRQVGFVTSSKRGKKTFINLPVESLLNAALFGRIMSSLSRVEEMHLVIEIQDPEALHRLHGEELKLFSNHVHAMRKMGVEVWIDDITAFALMVCIEMGLKIDGIKISHRLFAHFKALGQGLTDFVKACRKVSNTILAEGIETAEDVHLAIDAGCDLGQGFLWQEFCLKDS
ncbi:EAL domain-containing protein [Aeromonas simiae]|uniref:EAL domain-containing protein n=1 Tax=Aeromonas simiae TaxID=218936 RepID=A0A5J6WZ97_9GAMM|nr:EAL domain-containing protein [Aeromonas simiae]QFI55601.1 EAL domain-containing protein [Aeromonas simiae]